MIKRLAPNSIRAIPEQYQGIYTHGTLISAPQCLVCLSGQIGVSPTGETRKGFDQQCVQAMDNVEALLAEAGLEISDILRVVYYVTDADFLPALSALRQARWSLGHAPAVTTLVVAGLAAQDFLVEIEVTAAR